MKFIKTTDGCYINPSQVEIFFVTGYGLSAEAGAKMNNGDLYTLAAFELDPKSMTKFDPEKAAQAWLDDFVAQLNTEDF